MRFLASCFVISAIAFAACGSPPKKVEDSIKGDTASETCCCKSNPLTSEDGKPLYEVGNVMECSSKQGECVPEVQCQQAAPAE